ncbi:phosphohexomutase domain-containing protein [Psychrobacter ciconiae]|uniref:phosphomannomutase n=1 Tax=Psychrobacter ciconiae TaxID=1553449 RepID=UPI0019181182|nr:phosphomannomutase [Psychrobacter ciconiae]
MTQFCDQRSLFRAYDVRGHHAYFSDDFIQALGVAFAKLFAESNFDGQIIVIGFDVRLKSDDIAENLASVLAAFGFKVKVLGLVTTPMMAFWAQQFDGHGIMVTASHSDKDTLGIKWIIENNSASEADIAALFHRLAAPQTLTSNPKNIAYLPAQEVANRYIDAIAQVFAKLYPTSNLKLPFTIVIDCMNGATSAIAKALFSRFCQRVILINDTPDGRFPQGNPDPTEPNRLAELQQSLIVLEADLGLAFDGDGDRLMIVDNRGKVVAPDHLLYLLASAAISFQQSPNAKQILFDIKCSHHLPKLLKNLGATPVMTRTGSSILRQELDARQDSALFAGELSGHFIFNDGLFIRYDDAIYASLRLLFWLDNQSQLAYQSQLAAPKQSFQLTDNWGEPKSQNRYQLTDITQALPLMVSTADHYLPLGATAHQQPLACSIVSHLALLCQQLQAIAANLDANASVIQLCDCDDCPKINISKSQAQQLLPKGTVLNCIDGVRLDFASGFGVLRKSNTSHSLTVRFAGDSVADLLEIRSRFVALCQWFDADLAQKIAGLLPEC